MAKSEIFEAVKDGNCLRFNEIVKSESNIRYIIERDGLLHTASRYGHTDIVTELLKMGALCDQRYGIHSRLPLHEASLSGNIELVSLITEHSRKNIDVRDSLGFSAVHICAMNGELDCLRVLTENRASLTLEDNEGLQPAHWAARRDHSPIIIYIFNKDIDLNVRCAQGRTPLHYAALSNSLGALKCLIKCHGDISIGDNQEAYPIHYSAQYGSLDCLRFLAALQNPFSAKQSDGKTPAHLAALTGSYECLHWLLDNGADLSVTDDELNTIGHMACRGGYGEVMFCYLSHGGCADTKNNLGEDLNQISRRYGHPVKYDSAKKGELVCPLCQIESNKNEWDEQHAPSSVLRAINKSRQSLYKPPLGSYIKNVKTNKNVYNDKKTEINRRHLETINIGKESSKKDRVVKQARRGVQGQGYRDLITRYYGEHINDNQ